MINISEITLKHGNCLELMKEIPDESIDMILTDPPYGTTACKWDTIIPLDKLWDECRRIIKPNVGGIIIQFSTIYNNLKLKSY